VHRINLAEDKEQWRPLLNTVSIPQFPRKAGSPLYFRDFCFSRKTLSNTLNQVGGRWVRTARSPTHGYSQTSITRLKGTPPASMQPALRILIHVWRGGGLYKWQSGEIMRDRNDFLRQMGREGGRKCSNARTSEHE
jgi:hypothetical protein